MFSSLHAVCNSKSWMYRCHCPTILDLEDGHLCVGRSWLTTIYLCMQEGVSAPFQLLTMLQFHWLEKSTGIEQERGLTSDHSSVLLQLICALKLHIHAPTCVYLYHTPSQVCRTLYNCVLSQHVNTIPCSPPS